MLIPTWHTGSLYFSILFSLKIKYVIIFCEGRDRSSSMTRNQKHGSKKRIKSCDIWSDLNHDLLLLIMMQLGVIDYVAFSRVCKSWRSLALCNKNKFIATRQPMSILLSTTLTYHEKECHLVDYEGRKLKINLPHTAGRNCIGVTCGYLILCGVKTSDFWLVNPITGHQLHLPFPFPFPIPYDVDAPRYLFTDLGATLVFSHSLSKWVFIVFKKHLDKIWFCIVGKREWDCVSTSFPIYHLQAFKGRIYTVYENNHVGELTLCPTPKVTLLDLKNIPEPKLRGPRFLSAGDNLYVMDLYLENPNKKIYEINLSRMEWVSLGKAGERYGIFYGSLHCGAMVIRAEPWADHQSKYRRYAMNYDVWLSHDETGEGRFWYKKMWYFFHDCLDVSSTLFLSLF